MVAKTTADGDDPPRTAIPPASTPSDVLSSSYDATDRVPLPPAVPSVAATALRSSGTIERHENLLGPLAAALHPEQVVPLALHLVSRDSKPISSRGKTCRDSHMAEMLRRVGGRTRASVRSYAGWFDVVATANSRIVPRSIEGADP